MTYRCTLSAENCLWLRRAISPEKLSTRHPEDTINAPLKSDHKSTNPCTKGWIILWYTLYARAFPVEHNKAFSFPDLLHLPLTGCSWRAFWNILSVLESLSPALSLRNPENCPLSKKNSYYSLSPTKGAVVADQEPLQNGTALFTRSNKNLFWCLLLDFYLVICNR